MPQIKPTGAPLSECDLVARSIVERCVRNSYLEDLHAGTFPDSKSGDYADVKVVTPYGEIPWNRLSRISDEEMKRLMIDVVNKVFTYLAFPDILSTIGEAGRWQTPQFDEQMMSHVKRHLGKS